MGLEIIFFQKTSKVLPYFTLFSFVYFLPSLTKEDHTQQDRCLWKAQSNILLRARIWLYGFDSERFLASSI